MNYRSQKLLSLQKSAFWLDATVALWPHTKKALGSLHRWGWAILFGVCMFSRVCVGFWYLPRSKTCILGLKSSHWPQPGALMKIWIWSSGCCTVVEHCSSEEDGTNQVSSPTVTQGPQWKWIEKDMFSVLELVWRQSNQSRNQSASSVGGEAGVVSMRCDWHLRRVSRLTLLASYGYTTWRHFVLVLNCMSHVCNWICCVNEFNSKDLTRKTSNFLYFWKKKIHKNCFK